LLVHHTSNFLNTSKDISHCDGMKQKIVLGIVPSTISKRGFVPFELMQEAYLQKNGKPTKPAGQGISITILRLEENLSRINSAAGTSAWQYREDIIYEHFLEAKSQFALLPKANKHSYQDEFRLSCQRAIKYFISRIQLERALKREVPCEKHMDEAPILLKAKEVKSFLLSLPK